MLKVATSITISNEMGLHTRPATMIVKLLQYFKCEVVFRTKDREANAKSVLSLLMLALSKGEVVTIEARGPDASLAIEKLSSLFSRHFDEGEGV